MGSVVMTEDHLLDTRVLNTLDHGSVVHGIGQDDTVGQLLGQSTQSRIVGNIARGEDQSRGLVVQGSQFILESQMKSAVSGNVAGTTGTGTILAQSGLHGLDHDRVLGHAQVIVRAPDSDLVLGPGSVGARELLGQPVDVVEEAVGLVLMLLVELGLVGSLIVIGLASGGDSMGSRDDRLEGAS